MLGLKTALVGDLEKIMDAEVGTVGKALRSARDETALEVRNTLRGQVRNAGLGRKLEKAWRVLKFPPRGRKTLSPAALIFSRSNRIHAAFERGGTIRAREAEYLVIPLLPAVRQKWDRSLRRSRGPLPRKWSEVRPAGERFGRLRFVEVDGETALLVADKATRTGRVSKRKRRKKGDRGVPVFLLKKKVRLRKVLDIKSVRAQAPTRFSRNIAKRLRSAA
jgi:hypothetical protein